VGVNNMSYTRNLFCCLRISSNHS